MMRFLFLLILTLFGTAHAAVVDVSGMQSQFEQKVIDRLRMGLDPVLGKEKYTLSVRVDYRVQNEQLRPTDTYFPKLGMTAPTPSTGESTHVIQIERWVQLIDIEVSRSEDVQGVSDEDLRTRVSGLVKAFGNFKQKVTITSFKPASPSSMITWQERIPWTPVAILGAAFMMALMLLLAARSLASATTNAANTTAAAAAQAGGAGSSRDFAMDDMVSADKKKTDAEPVEGEWSREGLTKWHEWLKEDAASARDFVERLARSMDPTERFLLAYVFQHSDLMLVRPLLKKVSKEGLAAIKQSLGESLDTSDLLRSDRQLSQFITQYYVDESLDSDNLIKTVHDFSVDECVFAAETEPSILAVFMKCLSTPHMERIVAQLSFDHFQAFLAAADEISPSDMNKLAVRARTSILERRKAAESRQALPLAKWMVVASHLDGEKEQAFYSSAAVRLPAAELVQFAAENFPQFLAVRLPDHILKPVMNSYTFEERAELMFTSSDDDRRRYLAFYQNEARVSDLLTVELDQIANEPQRVRGLNKRRAEMNRDFLNRVRKFVRSTPEMQSAAEELVRSWVEEQKGPSDDVSAA